MGPIWRDDLVGGFGLAVIDLPAPLRQAVDEALQGIPSAELTRAAEALSKRYRAELRDGRRHLDDDPAALAYLATRLPATYAAVQSCLESIARDPARFRARGGCSMPGPVPARRSGRRLELWPRLEEAVLIEGSPVMRKWGERLADAAMPAHNVAWKTADLRAGVARCRTPRSRGPRLCAGRAGACRTARPHRPALGGDRRHASPDRARHVSGLAADPRGPRAAAGRRGRHRGALPPCGRLPAAAAGLVSFRPPPAPLAPASPGEDGRASLGGREVHLSRRIAPAGLPCRRRASSPIRGRARAMSV